MEINFAGYETICLPQMDETYNDNRTGVNLTRTRKRQRSVNYMPLSVPGSIS